MPGATSMNNQDYMPGTSAQGRQQIRSNRSSRSQSVHCDHLPATHNGFSECCQHHRYTFSPSIDSSALQRIPERQSVTTNFDSHKDLGCQDLSPSEHISAASAVGQTKAFGVWRNGKVIWIPDYIFEQFSGPLDNLTEDSSQSHLSQATPSRPDVRISIPANIVDGSVSSHSSSSSRGSETWSPHHSIETSRTSFDASTPAEESKWSTKDNQMVPTTTYKVFEGDNTGSFHLTTDTQLSNNASPPPLQPRNPRRISGQHRSFRHDSDATGKESELVAHNIESRERLARRSMDQIPHVPEKSRKRDFIPESV